MSTYNTNSNSTNNNNPYGHLLDKYLDSDHLDWKLKKQREKEAKTRYGHLLDYAKPDYSALERIANIEDAQIEYQKRMEEEKQSAALRRQERIEAERSKEEAHNARVKEFGESFIERKREQIKAAEVAKEEKRKEDEKQQSMHDQINGLMRINPELAEFYVQTMKKARVI